MCIRPVKNVPTSYVKSCIRGLRRGGHTWVQWRVSFIIHLLNMRTFIIIALARLSVKQE